MGHLWAGGVQRQEDCRAGGGREGLGGGGGGVGDKCCHRPEGSLDSQVMRGPWGETNVAQGQREAWVMGKEAVRKGGCSLRIVCEDAVYTS